MNFFEKAIQFIGSVKERTVSNPNTTVGGSVGGVVLAAVVGKIEQMSGCHFSTAFASIDWLQLALFTYSTINGALMTDANKTLSTTAPAK